jgi:hypothetical protein
MTTAQPYASMQTLRQAYDVLLEGSAKRPVDEEGSKKVDEFIRRAVATGRILDTVSDRREAQGMIDYWVASSYTKFRNRGSVQTSSRVSPEGATNTKSSPVSDGARVEWVDNQLESFDQTVVEAAAREGDAFLAGLSSGELELVQSILFQLIDLPDAGDSFSSSPASVEALRKFGDPKKVDSILSELKKSGILSVRTGDDGNEVVGLHYLALTRKWKWFDEQIERRMSFRDLALSWVRTGRARRALLNWSLTWKFRKYSDLNGWETDFINRSSLSAMLTGVVALSLFLLVPAVGFAWFALYNIYADNRSRSDRVNYEIRTFTTPLPRKIADIKWLARYRLPIDVATVNLSSPNRKELSELFAPGAVFEEARLTAVDFERAYLANASFNRSVITRTSFSQAALVRARFDLAEFCGKVDFSGADLQYTSLKGMRYGAAVPQFSRTAWWLAYGLGYEEIDLFHTLFPSSEVVKNDRFKADLSDIEKRIDQAKDESRERAIALNMKAWTLAIYGVVADGIAEKSVVEAIALLPGVDKVEKTVPLPGSGSTDVSTYFNDTLAYILLQKPAEDATQKRKNLERAEALWADSIKDAEGDVQFRYAIALHALGRDNEANRYLDKAVIDEFYEPSHELYLLKDYITGDFRQRILKLTGRGGKRQPPSRCPDDKKT